jgi:hypothetical protein
LVLFQFRKIDQGANKLFAFLVTDPTTMPGGSPGHPKPGIPPGLNDHEAEIQVVTGEDAKQLLPRGLRHRARIDITIPGPDGVVPSRSYDDHVPKLAQLASKTTPPLQKVKPPADNPLPPNPEPADRLLNWHYIRNVITVNRGRLRVKDVVIWDEGGFPIGGNAAGVGALPATAAEVKFLGTGVSGHAANECVLEIPDTDIVDIESPEHPEIDGIYRSVRRRNQRAQSGTTDILIRNYEYQREKPVPWGLDFQWVFAAAGYGTVNLGPELDIFDRIGTDYDPDLHAEDRNSLLPGSDGRPFPYIVGGDRLTRLKPLTDIDSRPVCVPGDGGFG